MHFLGVDCSPYHCKKNSGKDIHCRLRVKQREISRSLLHSFNFIELLLYLKSDIQRVDSNLTPISKFWYMVMCKGHIRSPRIPFLFNFWKLNKKIRFMSGQQLCLFVKQHLAPYIFGLVNQLLANEWGGLMCVGPAAGSIKSSSHSRGPLTHTPPPSSLASDAPGYFSNIF
jgi:hypothetical protein